MLIRLMQLEGQYYNFNSNKSSSLWPKGLYLISIINTTAIDSSNKPKITCGGGKIIKLFIEGVITNLSEYWIIKI